MNITESISALLYRHDCVIIPGFGGFVCSYRSAQIHPVLNTLSPPSKAISFNINLRSNDGLLADYVAKVNRVSFQQANAAIELWVNTSVGLLENTKALTLQNIGRLVEDVEGGWHFEQNEKVNYLMSSFGLPELKAAPILRGKEVPITHQIEQPSRIKERRSINWRIAAAMVLLIGIGVFGTLMWEGKVIEPLKLNEAGMMSAIFSITKNTEPVLQPIPPSNADVPVIAEPAESKTEESATSPTAVPVVDNQPALKTEVTAPTHGYYIIIGAFGSQKNIELARKNIMTKHPSNALFEENVNGLTRIGYMAGANETEAKEALISAKTEDSAYWLLQK